VAPKPGIELRTYLIIPRVRDGADLGAVRDDERRRVLDVHKASDGDEMRPSRPVPFGSASRRPRTSKLRLSACFDTRQQIPPYSIVLMPTRARGMMRYVLGPRR